jgi:hypothetical protein
MRLIDEALNVNLAIHKPERRGYCLDGADVPWEEYIGYPAIMKVGDTYRMYYQARGASNPDADPNLKKEMYCVAFSKDGKTFTRPNLGKIECCGSKDNNIIILEDRFIDNFTIHYDENPDCPADEKFKALSLLFHIPPIKREDGSDLYTELLYYKSSDGINFEYVRVLDVPGVFDSYNIVFWDKESGEYKMYIRDFHNADGSRSDYAPVAAMELAYRDVRITTSKDFVHWTSPEMITFEDGNIHIQLYTGMIFQYKRGNMFLGLPTRYNNRPNDTESLEALPQWGGLRKKWNEEKNRGGSVANDVGIMTSRDGKHFDRWNGAYMTTGIERPDNWAYGNGYCAYTPIETESDFDGEVTELSLYNTQGHNVARPRVMRYALRLDGFYSWQADFTGGTVVTRPLTFEGEELEINFATSSLGHVRTFILDVDGKEIEGYDSKRHFGDSLNRVIKFEKPLSALSGKTVRLKFEIKDADLYAFKFN